MTSSNAQVRVVQKPIADEIRRLETFVGRMEHRYECDSAAMLTLTASGERPETAEIARWLIAFQSLAYLKGLVAGTTPGSPTSSTR
jgi:hypothetical protein